MIQLRKIKEKTRIIKLLLNNDGNKDITVYFKVRNELRYSKKSICQYYLLKKHYQEMESKKKKKFNIKKIIIKNKVYNLKKLTDFNRSFALYRHITHNNKICCEFCNKNLTLDSFTVDHFIPLSREGEDHHENYKISCNRCNSIKGSIHPLINKKVYKEFLKHVNSGNTIHFADQLINSKEISDDDKYLYIKDCKPCINTYLTILNHLIYKKYDKINNLDFEYIKTLEEIKSPIKMLKTLIEVQSYITQI